MENKIEITLEIPVEKETELRELIRRCAIASLQAEHAPEGCEVDVLIVNGETIRQMNREYREKDAVTDVLSFPMLEFLNGRAQEELERDPDTGLLMLGDMVLNYERACEQAQEFAHSVERECGFLTVHSILHLLGYDHERSEEERRQQREHEENILKSLGLTRE